MIGQWIRITSALLIDEVGWHTIKDAVEVQGDVDHRWRLDLGCHVVILIDPRKCERGLPGAAAVICPTCITSKDKENAS